MFVKFNDEGKISEIYFSEKPSNAEGFIETDKITSENQHLARLVDGKVVFIEESEYNRENTLVIAKQELVNNLLDLRNRIDLNQSVAELTKKLDLVIQVLHAVVLANNLKPNLPENEQKKYDETVAFFADQVNMMNVYEYQKTLQDIQKMYEQLVKEIKEYYVQKQGIYQKHNLSESDLVI